jgi:CHRD domain-containing protein
MRRTLWALVGVMTTFLVMGVGVASAVDVKVALSGSQEVPAVTTSATGSGTITVAADQSISGKITTTGVKGTAAHIHVAAPGTNGPVVVPLTKDGENGWAVGPGAKLQDAHYQAFKDGNLYVNVHSAANPNGEIRGQIKP